jgi:transmembrane sensor
MHQLLDRYIDGTASPAEWEELLVLVEGIGPADTETLSEPLLELWEKARQQRLPSRAHLLDREKMFAAIVSDEGDVAVLPSAVRTIQWTRIAAAAVITGALVLGGIILFNRGKEQDLAIAPSLAALEKVKPGTEGAILTLADGRQVPLDSMATAAIPNQDNTIITNSNGKLAYTPARGLAHKKSDMPSFNTVATARANQYQLLLPDGSKVWLNAASSIRFPTAFTGHERTVEVTGEVYFEIAKDASKPFFVRCGATTVAVLGTSFNINAYADEAYVRTSLLEGSVKVSNGSKSSALAPGQESFSGADEKLTIAAGNIEMAIAWKNGYFQFDKASLPVILRQIGRWYDLDIVYTGVVPDRIFQGKIQRSLPLSGILHLLQQGDVHFTLQGKTLKVTK